jgi:hypothetical protein
MAFLLPSRAFEGAGVISPIAEGGFAAELKASSLVTSRVRAPTH